MNRRTPRSSPSTGRTRTTVTAILLAFMFLVPLTPLGSAANPTFDVEEVSGSTARSTNAAYNFTFTVASGDDGKVGEVQLVLPTGFDLGAITETNLDADYEDDSGSTTFNLNGSTPLAAGNYYFKVESTDTPQYADDFTATITMINSTTGTEIGESTASFDVDAIALTAALDDAQEDNMVFGSGATTDYWFEITKDSKFQSSDSVNITFPSGFDLSDASITNGEIVGNSVGYDIQVSDLSSSTFTIRVEDVVNDEVSTNTDYDFVTKVLDDEQRTVASGTIDVDLIATGIAVSNADGSTTAIEEGKEQGDAVKVSLLTKPAATVTVTIDGGDQVDPEVDTLTFTTANWGTEQEVDLIAVDDSDIEGKQNFAMRFTSESTDDNYDDLDRTFLIEIFDDDVGLVLTHLDEDGDEDDDTVVTEGDSGGDEYEVVLSTIPSDTVTVTFDVPEHLALDEDELTFTKSKWDDPQTIKVTSARTDDDDYQDDEELTIVHITESDDEDYDELEFELDVTLEDDEHPALGLTDKQIRDANKLVKLTLTEEDDGILLEWELPDQDDLDDIFDSDGEIEIEGIQILYSNSPYVIADTFEVGDAGYDAEEWTHDFDDDAALSTKYLVTMFFQEDVGKWDSDSVPDTRDDGYDGDAIKEPVLPWWGWLVLGIVAVVVLALVIVAVIASQNRKAYGDADWDDAGDDDLDAAETAPAKEKKAKATKHDLECPVCDHQFSVKGIKPIKTECPNCGAKGVLN